MLTYFVIIPVLIALFMYLFSGVKSGRILALVFQTAFVIFSFYLFILGRAETVYTRVGDFPDYMGIILRADNMAAVFILLTTVVFLFVTIYNINDPRSRTFWFLLFLLEATLTGLFLTRDLFNTFVLIEVGTLLVTTLLMYDRARRNMFAGMSYLMINIVVMQFYLFGLGYLYILTGTLDMVRAGYMLANVDPANQVLPYALIMTAMASKCSLLPLLTWLPKVNSISGTRFTIAAIMSGLHIKSGVYMFLRFREIFEHVPGDEYFIIISILTGLTGIVLSLAQKDIRLVLAYSTIAQIGLIMIGLNMDYEYAFYGSLFHILNHALFKVSLFMCAGMIISCYKISDINRIRGLWRLNKPIAIAAFLAIMGIVGMPMFNGSISKYFMMMGATGLLEWAMIVINLGTILICIKLCAMFFGHPGENVQKEPVDRCKQAATLILGGICFILGIFGEAFTNFTFNLEAHVDALSYLEKIGVFAASLAAGLLLTKFVIKDGSILKPLLHLDLSFKTMCMSVGGFFGITLLVAGFILI